MAEYKFNMLNERATNALCRMVHLYNRADWLENNDRERDTIMAGTAGNCARQFLIRTGLTSNEATRIVMRWFKEKYLDK